jgi:membrane protein
MRMMNLTERLEATFRWADELSGGALSILKDAIQQFGDTRASQAAAGMAYYALFSLFPLLLFLVAAGSFILESEQAYQQAVGLVTEAVPISRELIESNFQQVLRLRGPVGIVGLVGSLWSASGFFTTLASQINRAWPEADARNFLERRLVALGMVGSLAGLLALSLILSAVLDLLPQLQVPLGDGVSVYETPLWAVLSNVVPWLFTAFLFLGLYLWMPNTPVKRSAALGGALVAAVAWEVASNAFAWYLGSGLARYKIVYGSLGAVVALMLWIYISGWIILFGAHLSAAIAKHTP